MNLGQTLQQYAKMWHAPSGAHALLRTPPVGEQRYSIAGVKSHLRQAQRGVHGVVELGQAPDTRLQQPPRVEQYPNRLAALDLMNLGDQLAAPRRGTPGNIAELIAFAVVAEALKFASVPTLAFQTLLELDLPAANEINAKLLRLRKIGIDANRLFDSRPRPALGQAQRAL